MRKAFFALVYNGVRAAPLYDGKRQAFIGMLTITDFIHILHKYYRMGAAGEGAVKELETHKIATWKGVSRRLHSQTIVRHAEALWKDGKAQPLIWIDPNESLFKAVQMLCENHVHRLPVLDRKTGNITYILTHKRIIKYLYLYVSCVIGRVFNVRITYRADCRHETTEFHEENTA